VINAKLSTTLTMEVSVQMKIANKMYSLMRISYFSKFKRAIIRKNLNRGNISKLYLIKVIPKICQMKTETNRKISKKKIRKYVMMIGIVRIVN
jgi:hypothetical protein